jgi:hypothetical protein
LDGIIKRYEHRFVQPTFRTSPFHFPRISLGRRDGSEDRTTSIARP